MLKYIKIYFAKSECMRFYFISERLLFFRYSGTFSITGLLWWFADFLPRLVLCIKASVKKSKILGGQKYAQAELVNKLNLHLVIACSYPSQDQN